MGHAMAKHVRVMLSGVMALVVLAGGLWLARPEVAWAWASFQDSSDAYQRYAEHWPASRHVLEAHTRQDERDWQRARDSQSIPEIYAYLEQHSTGAFVGEARSAEDDLHFQATQAAGT